MQRRRSGDLRYQIEIGRQPVPFGGKLCGQLFDERLTPIGEPELRTLQRDDIVARRVEPVEA